MIPTNYDPRTSEEKWYQYWLEHRFFHSTVDKKRTPYCIVIPPPNVTGVLHMGHMLNNTIQDVLVRRARLLGKNACWVPGTDHASIATEAKVVAKLKSEGIEKRDLSRDEFLKHAWAWTEKHGGIILEQLKRLGASCDWDRTCFTMDEIRSASVIKVFIDLYNKGLIYKGVRMVNWDPSAKTAVSDEEVVYKEEHSKLYYLRYRIDGTEDEYITIATTRPETILGDSAVCVNPNDERFRHLAGKKCIVPLVNRVIPIIQDEYVDMEFGTGALKITPAHDINDYEIGYKHHLETIDIFNDDGTLNENAQLFVGKDRFVVRQEIIPELEKAGNLVKIEDYNNKVGYSERTNVVIEPKLSMQWFLKMKELAKPALDAVMNDDILLTPAKYKNTYRYWMENVKDWCISRQLWWGHQIPVYYLPDSNDYVVAENITEAVRLVKEKFGKDIPAEQLRQDEDCLDTWFSSWLWPISVFNGILEPDNEDINYYYPTNDLVSGPDILFFWMARMIMAGYEYRHEKPFSNLYLTGIVRDKLHRKMSKSLGNSPDPIDLINQYGADGVRVGMLLCAPAGGDLLFDESLPEQGRNFTTKIWNAFRLVSNWKVTDLEQPLHSKLALEWFEQYLNKCKETLNTQFEQYRISEALMTVYTGFRDEFSSWLLEIIKPGFEQPIDRTTYDKTIYLFEEMLQLLHPFMPFITEEIFCNLQDEEPSIMISSWPVYKEEWNFAEDEHAVEVIKEAVRAIRNVRTSMNVPPSRKAKVFVVTEDADLTKIFENSRVFFSTLASANEVVIQKDKTGIGEDAVSAVIPKAAIYMPFAELVDIEKETERLKKEEERLTKELARVNGMLANEKFVSKAPQAKIDEERAKLQKYTEMMEQVKTRLAQLGK